MGQSKPGRPRPKSNETAHIVFVGHGAERTGPPILLGHLLAGLARERPWGLSVLVARSGPLIETYQRTATSVQAVSTTREPLEPAGAALRRVGLNARATQIQQWRRTQVAKRLDPADLVYVNSATPPTAALLRSLEVAPEVPVVLHVHELDVGLRSTLDPGDLAFLLRRADRFIAASDPVARNLANGHGVDADLIVTCEEFVDVAALDPMPRDAARRELAIPDDVDVVGSVGLPDWRKDPEHLLRAIATVEGQTRTQPWVVWIGGDPNSVDGQRLADEAQRLGLSKRFRHVAHQDQPTRLLAGLDVFALPAREDAMPLAALEAAGAGLALVCFRTGGIADLCDAGAGIAINYPNTAAFGTAIVDLLTNKAKRVETGKRGRDLIRARHDRQAGTARIAAVLDDVLAETSSS